jgi:hypothetical protein
MGFKLNDTVITYTIEDNFFLKMVNVANALVPICIPISRANKLQQVAACLSEHYVVVHSFPDGTRFMKRETVGGSSQPI